MGRYISAVDEFDKVLRPNLVMKISKRSLRVQAYIGRGRAKTALRNFDVAIKDCDKGLKLNPEQEIEQQAYSYRVVRLPWNCLSTKTQFPGSYSWTVGWSICLVRMTKRLIGFNLLQSTLWLRL